MVKNMCSPTRANDMRANDVRVWYAHKCEMQPTNAAKTWMIQIPVSIENGKEAAKFKHHGGGLGFSFVPFDIYTH